MKSGEPVHLAHRYREQRDRRRSPHWYFLKLYLKDILSRRYAAYSGFYFPDIQEPIYRMARLLPGSGSTETFRSLAASTTILKVRALYNLFLCSKFCLDFLKIILYKT